MTNEKDGGPAFAINGCVVLSPTNKTASVVLKNVENIDAHTISADLFFEVVAE